MSATASIPITASTMATAPTPVTAATPTPVTVTAPTPVTAAAPTPVTAATPTSDMAPVTTAAPTVTGVGAVAETPDLIMCRELLPLLSCECLMYDILWLDVGRVLFNVTNGTDVGLQLWTTVTERIHETKRAANLCRTQYPQLRGSPFTVKTLAHYAATDVLERYPEFHRQQCSKLLDIALTSRKHEDIANVIYQLSCLNYIYTGSKVWYLFDHNDVVLKLVGTDEVRVGLIHLLHGFINWVRNGVTWRVLGTKGFMSEDIKIPGIRTSESETQLIKRLDKFIEELYSTRQWEPIHAVLTPMYCAPKLTDWNTNCIAFTDCVVEIHNGELYRRPAKLEDYITRTMGIAYPEKMSRIHWTMIKLNTWLDQLFPDPSLRHYVLKDTAALIFGGKAKPRLWIGGYSAGKSLWAQLVETTLGLYCCRLPASFDVLPSGIRVGFFFDAANIETTSASIITITDTHSLQRSYQPRTDILNRFVITPFLSHWTKDAKHPGLTTTQHSAGVSDVKSSAGVSDVKSSAGVSDVNESDGVKNSTGSGGAKNSAGGVNNSANVSDMKESGGVKNLAGDVKDMPRTFMANVAFEKEIRQLAPALGWLMLQYYPMLQAEGVIPPKIVTDFVTNLKESVDPYRQFMKMWFAARTEDVKYITVTELYTHFHRWAAGAYPEVSGITKQDFRNEIAARWSPPVNGKWDCSVPYPVSNKVATAAS